MPYNRSLPVPTHEADINLPPFDRNLILRLPNGQLMEEDIRIDDTSVPAPPGTWITLAWCPSFVVRVRHIL